MLAKFVSLALLAVASAAVFSTATVSSTPAPPLLELQAAIRSAVREAVASAAASASASSSVASSSPAMQFTITQSGLDRFRDILLPIINAKFQDLTIPNIQVQKSVPILGDLTIDITNIVIQNFNLPAMGIDITPPETLDLAVSGLDFDLNLDWHWRKVHWPHLSSGGSADVKPVNGAANIGVAITAADGRPHTAVAADSVTFGSFKITFHGSWLSWLYDLLTWLLQGTIKSGVQTAASAAIQKAIDDTLNAEFANLPLSGHVGGGRSRVNLDFSIVDTQMGSYTNSTGAQTIYLTVGDALAVADNSTGAACPLTPPPFPSVLATGRESMVQLLLADEFVNCVSWVSWANQVFSLVLTDETLPKSSPVRLNTSDWAIFIPQLALLYPNQLMSVAVSAPAAPAISTNPTTGVAGAATFALNTSVVGADGNETYVFTLTLAADLGLDVTVVNAQPPETNATVHLNMTALKTSFAVEDSRIGTIDLSLLDGLLNTVEPLLEELINAALASGLPLPVGPGFQFVEPQVSFFQGYLAVGSDFAYQPASA